jgi:hypothetical protein
MCYDARVGDVALRAIERGLVGFDHM